MERDRCEVVGALEAGVVGKIAWRASLDALEGLTMGRAAVAGDRLACRSGVPTFNGAVSRTRTGTTKEEEGKRRTMR